MSEKELKQDGMQAISIEELAFVSGGQVTGNYPGCTCASCGGMMLDDHYELHGAKRSRCMNCGTTRWYT